ncbi:MAG: hypothetical protein HN353_13065 [Bdellovibrionales bacterium]|nr:hypothetical protein [Bdellovibrionales bacterium]MBT3524979.1 hypothetical protein [Bdellovibrionales bacterium]MBT7670363.1 hypothetical protein [Bdellovibrionales bacterium]
MYLVGKLYLDSVKQICDQFKKNVEDNGLWEVLFDKDRKPRKERISQRIFFSIADYQCKVNNVDISPESNAGLGPVDFKLSRGSNEKVVIEVKLTSNPKMVADFEKQVEAYKKSESAHRSIYLLILVSDKHLKKVKKLFNYQKQLRLDGVKTADIILVDGTPKKSASNL